VAAAVVHLDVKPGNFILTADDTLKLHDFNLARFLESDVVTGERCDMQRLDCNIYRSPEECTGSPRLNEKADVYALGGFLYELLTRKKPFHYDGGTPLQGAGRFPTVPPPFRASNGTAHRALVWAVDRCFQLDPDERAGAREIADVLRGAVAAVGAEERAAATAPHAGGGSGPSGGVPTGSGAARPVPKAGRG